MGRKRRTLGRPACVARANSVKRKDAKARSPEEAGRADLLPFKRLQQLNDRFDTDFSKSVSLVQSVSRLEEKPWSLEQVVEMTEAYWTKKNNNR